MKYSSLLLIASIWLYTILCVSARTVSVQGDPPVTDANSFSGTVETFLEAFSQLETTSNPFAKIFRERVKKNIDSFETDKKFVQDAVNEGTEMEKKIQSISLTLKSSTVTLPTELQSELEEIEKNAAAELKKLKGVEDVKDIEEMHKRYKEKYAEFKGQMETLFKLILEQIKKEKAEEEHAKKSKGQSGQPQGGQASAPKVQSKDEKDAFVEKAKQLMIKFIQTIVPAAITINKDTEAISKKKKVASSARSNIRDNLIKVEQMEYHFLGAHKDLFKKDVASLTRLSMVPFAFAIMFGMFF